MSASLVLGIVGVLIALGGLVFTGLERRDRKRAVEDERHERRDAIALVRRQVEAAERQTELEEAAKDAAGAADLRVRSGGRDGLGWSFNLVNIGAAAATSVKAWIIRRDTGASVSVTLEVGSPLLPGEETQRRGLLIPLSEDLVKAPPPLALMLSWSDSRERERRDDYPIDL